jgi:hypothetical protein
MKPKSNKMARMMKQLTDITLWEGYIYVLPDSPFQIALKRTEGKIVKAQIYTSRSGISKIHLIIEDGQPEVNMTIPSKFLEQCIRKFDTKAAKVLFNR